MAPFTGSVPPVNGALSYRCIRVYLQARASVPPLLGRLDRWPASKLPEPFVVASETADGAASHPPPHDRSLEASLRSRIELRERRVGEADTFAGACITLPRNLRPGKRFECGEVFALQVGHACVSSRGTRQPIMEKEFRQHPGVWERPLCRTTVRLAPRRTSSLFELAFAEGLP